ISVNGKIAGVHLGVEDPFYFDVTELLCAGENRITVRTSKPHDKDVDGFTFGESPHRNQTPHGLTPGACYNVSGIDGEVALKFLPRVFIEDLYLDPDVETGEIKIQLTAKNLSADTVSATLRFDARLSPAGEIENEITLSCSFAPGENRLCTSLKIPAPRLWDTVEPNLYAVTAELFSDFGVHSAHKKCGFRTFRVGSDGYFYLNGRRILMRCSHTGNSFPESTQHISRDPELLRKDFLMAKATGFNTIRFISGSALPVQLDLCDEIGLMIYVEPLSSWLALDGEHTVDIYLHNLFSMIKRDRSHPCVTAWGLLNETPSTPPHSKACTAAIECLPELRKLDPSRLVIFSSGRWDARRDVGSFCNPGSEKWEYLWGTDGDCRITEGDLGDIHYYPDSVPLRKPAKERMRSFGSNSEKPVFVSESGVGSALDTVSAVRYYDRPDTVHIAPDIQLYKKMNDQLMADIEKFGFSDLIPLPSVLMDKSMENHVYYREQAFDQLRANPKICGISLTGLLDHSTCGEGLWTIYRTFKPGIADVLQDGFAPLRWCVFLSAPAIFPGSKLTVEAALASEDKLFEGEEYRAAAGIFDKSGFPVEVRRYSFVPTSDQIRSMVIPVFNEEWNTESLAPGEYTFKIELTNGGLATCGIKKFHVIKAAASESGRKVCAFNLSEDEKALVASLGFKVTDMENYTPDSVILAGPISEENAEMLRETVKNGAHLVAARGCCENDRSESVLPPEIRPSTSKEGDWLYHRESFFRPGDPFFKDMITGLGDALLYTDVITANHFRASGPSVPDETHAFAFSTGYPNGEGYLGGFKLATYRLGAGAVTLNTYDILDSAATVPYARQLLVNILENV
ncbi:MAG: hypothetical protein IKZ19_08860, partial [Clostridia bacterium]|nr:hypothetical protein [Clostridia bacterium]